jgi:hypothetical protein
VVGDLGLAEDWAGAEDWAEDWAGVVEGWAVRGWVDWVEVVPME